MSTKILIVGQLPPPYHGSNVMTEMTLRALQQAGYKSVFVNKSFSKDMKTIGRFSIRKLLRIPILALLLLKARIVEQPKLCIYFIGCSKGAFLVDAFLVFLLRVYRLPYILRFGGKGFRDLQNQSLFWRLLVSVTLSNALGGIVVGETLKEDVDLFISRDRLVTVPNAIEWQPLMRQPLRKEYVQVLFLSNLTPSKGPMEFLKAAKIVIHQEKSIRFVLAGAVWSQPFYQELQSYISNAELSDFVEMPGGVYGEQKEDLFSSSDIFVFPTYYETFGIVNVEAMRAGLPVISSPEGAIPEVVQDGVTGYIVNPKNPEEIADRILRLVRDADLRERMGRAGREAFESKYTLSAYARNLDVAICFFNTFLQSTK